MIGLDQLLRKEVVPIKSAVALRDAWRSIGRTTWRLFGFHQKAMSTEYLNQGYTWDQSTIT